jgi:hypothetical protein
MCGLSWVEPAHRSDDQRSPETPAVTFRRLLGFPAATLSTRRRSRSRRYTKPRQSFVSPLEAGSACLRAAIVPRWGSRMLFVAGLRPRCWRYGSAALLRNRRSGATNASSARRSLPCEGRTSAAMVRRAPSLRWSSARWRVTSGWARITGHREPSAKRQCRSYPSAALPP